LHKTSITISLQDTYNYSSPGTVFLYKMTNSKDGYQLYR